MMFTSSQRKNADLWIFVVQAGFAYSVYYYYFHGVVMGRPYPDNTFLFYPADQFADFRNVVESWFQYLPNDPSANISYFPATYLVVSFFRTIAKSSSTIFSLLCLFALFIAGTIKTSLTYLDFLDRQGKGIFLFVALFFSFPFICAFDRSNFELVVYLFLSFSFYSYRKKRDLIAGFFLGFAGAMKFYPGILILVFVFQKRWSAVKSTIVSAILITILALTYLSGSIFQNIERMLLNMSLFTQAYAVNDAGLNFGNSIFGVIKIINKTSGHYDVGSLLSVYTPSIIIVFLVILYFMYRYKNFFELWQYVSVLTIIMNIFPMVSGDYKMIHLFIPVLHWLDESKTHQSVMPYWLLWGLLFIPKQHTWLGSYEGIILDPLLMLTLMLIIFIDVWRKRKLMTTIV